MKALGERSIASFTRFVLDAVWWLGITGLIFVTGVLVFSFSFGLESKKVTMSLPVALELNSPIHSNSSSSETNARIEKIRGQLRFPARNGAFFYANMLLVILFFAFLLWVLFQLRLVFRSLSRGVPFIPENARRIRWVGFTIIFAEFARAALIFLWSYYTSLHFTADAVRFVASTDLSGTTIIGGLAVLVIAEVFREGTRLHEEQSLTI
jgi:hypothetical protein